LCFTQIIHHANLAGWRKLAVLDNDVFAMTAFTIMQGGQTNGQRLGDDPGFVEIGRTHFAERPANKDMYSNDSRN
jgi:hypothetical protein